MRHQKELRWFTRAEKTPWNRLLISQLAWTNEFQQDILSCALWSPTASLSFCNTGAAELIASRMIVFDLESEPFTLLERLEFGKEDIYIQESLTNSELGFDWDHVACWLCLACWLYLAWERCSLIRVAHFTCLRKNGVYDCRTFIERMYSCRTFTNLCIFVGIVTDVAYLCRPLLVFVGCKKIMCIFVAYLSNLCIFVARLPKCVLLSRIYRTCVFLS